MFQYLRVAALNDPQNEVHQLLKGLSVNIPHPRNYELLRAAADAFEALKSGGLQLDVLVEVMQVKKSQALSVDVEVQDRVQRVARHTGVGGAEILDEHLLQGLLVEFLADFLADLLFKVVDVA